LTSDLAWSIAVHRNDEANHDRSSGLRVVHGGLMRSRLLLVLIAIASYAALLACEGTANYGNGEPLILPNVAMPGSTVGMAIDSNYLPDLVAGPGLEYHNLTADNVTLRITTGTTVHATVTPRAVFDVGPTHVPSLYDSYEDAIVPEPGASLTVVVFDIPDAEEMPNLTLPADVVVTLVVDGTPSSLVTNTLHLLDATATPIVFNDNSDPAGMEPLPMIRILGSSNTGGFDPYGTDLVGGIEFDVTYDSDLMENLSAVPVTAAVNGTALVGPEVAGQGTDVTVHVLVMDPNGMQEGHLTEGPFVDLVFDKLDAFDESDVTLSNLKIVDRDGDPLFGSNPDPGDYLVKIARKNS
jgi:hypothetical protein